MMMIMMRDDDGFVGSVDGDVISSWTYYIIITDILIYYYGQFFRCRFLYYSTKFIIQPFS